MQLHCDQEQLAAALKAVRAAVPSRPLTVMNGGVLLSADGRLEVAATDREIAIRCRVNAQITNPGQVVLPASTITDLVAVLNTERIDLALDEGTDTLELHCGRTQAHVRGWKAEDFPALPVPAGEPVARVEARALKDAIGRVLYAASTDASRPTLCGVLMRFSEGQATLVAVDGFRLAKHTVPLVEPVAEPLDLVVPASGMRELQKLAREGEVSIALDEDRRHVIFETGDVVIAGQLGGKFPNYEQIIPQEWGVRAVVSQTALRQACRTARALRNEAGILQIEFSPERVVISATSVEAGEGKTELEAAVEGPRTEVTLCIKYLTDAVAAAASGQIVITTGSGEKSHQPVIVRPVGVEGQLGLIMPMQVGR